MPDTPVTRRERERHMMLTRFYIRLRDLAEDALASGTSEADVHLAIESAIDAHNASNA